jgi:hypothetical protein
MISLLVYAGEGNTVRGFLTREKMWFTGKIDQKLSQNYWRSLMVEKFKGLRVL